MDETDGTIPVQLFLCSQVSIQAPYRSRKARLRVQPVLLNGCLTGISLTGVDLVEELVTY
jgi:hypothetical protein